MFICIDTTDEETLKADYLKKLDELGVIAAEDALRAVKEDDFSFNWIEEVPEQEDAGGLDMAALMNAGQQTPPARVQDASSENAAGEEFKEADHPRDEGGKFTSGSGSTGGGLSAKYKGFMNSEQSSAQRRGFGVKANANGGGYIGGSMSYRANKAYEDGEMPKSKWTKQAILGSIYEELDPEGNENEQVMNLLEKGQQLSKEDLQDVFLKYASWHHTGTFYTPTDFYKIDYEKIQDDPAWFLEDIEDKLARKEQAKQKAKEERASKPREKKAESEEKAAVIGLDYERGKPQKLIKGRIKGGFFYPENPKEAGFEKKTVGKRLNIEASGEQEEVDAFCKSEAEARQKKAEAKQKKAEREKAKAEKQAEEAKNEARKQYAEVSEAYKSIAKDPRPLSDGELIEQYKKIDELNRKAYGLADYAKKEGLDKDSVPSDDKVKWFKDTIRKRGLVKKYSEIAETYKGIEKYPDRIRSPEKLQEQYETLKRIHQEMLEHEKATGLKPFNISDMPTANHIVKFINELKKRGLYK